jgi:hypothetical protein
MTLFFLGGMHSHTAMYMVWSRYGATNLPDWEWVEDLPEGVSQVAHWVIRKTPK